jgi:hypothetical protein
MIFCVCSEEIMVLEDDVSASPYYEDTLIVGTPLHDHITAGRPYRNAPEHHEKGLYTRYVQIICLIGMRPKVTNTLLTHTDGLGCCSLKRL